MVTNVSFLLMTIYAYAAMGEPAITTALLRSDSVGNQIRPRNNSAFIVLVRNEELDGIIYSMRQTEQNFNTKF